MNVFQALSVQTGSPSHLWLCFSFFTFPAQAIGMLFWMLARKILRMRGTIGRSTPWDVKVDLFFYRYHGGLLKVTIYLFTMLSETRSVVQELSSLIINPLRKLQMFFVLRQVSLRESLYPVMPPRSEGYRPPHQTKKGKLSGTKAKMLRQALIGHINPRLIGTY